MNHLYEVTLTADEIEFLTTVLNAAHDRVHSFDTCLEFTPEERYAFDNWYVSTTKALANGKKSLVNRED